jgi:hypothetical protein
MALPDTVEAQDTDRGRPGRRFQSHEINRVIRNLEDLNSSNPDARMLT